MENSMGRDKIHMLLVEDDPDQVQLIRSIFEPHSERFDLCVASNLREARKYLSTAAPDLAIIDLQLPDGSGLDLIRPCQDKMFYPIVVLTANGNEQMAVEAMKKGALDYVVKSKAAFDNLPHTVSRSLREWRHINRRKQAEQALEKVNRELERRVVERTRELQESNSRLMQQISERKLAEERLRRYQQIISSTTDLMSFIDKDYTYLAVNQAYLLAHCKPPEEIVGRTVPELIGKHLFVNVIKDRLDRCLKGETIHFQHWFDFRGHGRRYMDVAYYPYREASAQITGIVASLRDITEIYRAQEQLRLAASVFESTMEGVIITDASANIIAVNPAFTEITGYKKKDVLGRNTRILKSGRHEELFYQSMWASILTTGRWRGEIWNRNRAGTIYPAWLTISAVKDISGKLTHYVAAFSDISALKHSEEKLNHLAHHDALTDLPNRLLLDARLDHCIEQARRDKSKIALLFLDLDEFKHINDGLGHPVGDEVLKQVASRLFSRVRADDTVARLGGDEFVIAMGRIESPRDAAHLAEEILADISRPISTGAQELFVTGSIGISLYPQDGLDITTLLRNADAAMYRAKEQGRNNYQFYTTRFTADAFERMRLQSDLQRALDKREFVLHYQPQIELSDGRLAGAEVLVRWWHPKMGLVSPATFIPLAEQTGQIIALGDWVLRNACEQWVQWQVEGVIVERIAVNLSLRQIHDKGLVQKVAEALEQTGCPPQHLELEITESVIMREEEHALKVLQGLRSLGVSLSIDDFGTGYSSLSYLKRMPIAKLKIDRSFVRDIPVDPEDAAISRAVIALGKSLQLIIIAEGVENNAQLDFVHSQGCDQAQGYFYSRPLPAKKFKNYLKHHALNPITFDQQ